MGGFFEKKIGQPLQPPAGQVGPAYPGMTPYQPQTPATAPPPAHQVPVPASGVPGPPGAPQGPSGPTFAADRQGVGQLINSLPPGVNPMIVLAENWAVGAGGAKETAEIGQCPKCGSHRFSRNGVGGESPARIFNTITNQWATPSPSCLECGYNTAGFDQDWSAPRRVG